MSIIGATIAVSSIAAGGVVRHSKQVYRNKIDSLSAYAERLKSHLETLEKYEKEVPTFWDDEVVSTYLNKLTTKIMEVRDAMEAVENAKITLEEIDDDLFAAEDFVKNLFDSSSALSNIG